MSKEPTVEQVYEAINSGTMGGSARIFPSRPATISLKMSQHTSSR